MTDWWRQWLHSIRLLHPRNRRAAEEELEEEIQSHLEIEAEEYLDAGMSPSEARRAARRAFGSPCRYAEDTRESWGVASVDRLWQDVRYGCRMLAKKRIATAVAVLSLGLGIGVNAAVFTILKAALFGAPPLYRDANRLVTVWETSPHEPGERQGCSPPSFLAWQEEASLLEAVGAVQYLPITVRFEDYPVPMDGQAASASLLPTLGVEPLLGRNFLPEEESPEAEPVSILSYGLWQGRFGSDPQIVGKTIPIDSRNHTIVGVMPRGFWAGSGTSDLWVPLRLKERPWTRDDRRLRVVAKLRPGVSGERAEARLEGVAERLEKNVPGSSRGWGVRMDPVRGIDALEGGIPPGLLQLLGALGLVLLIACTNVAVVMVARGTARQTETALRSALGASRLRLIRQLLTESLLLSGLSCVVGLFMALWGVHLLTVFLPGDLGHTLDVKIDGSVFALAVAISALTGLFSGIAPAVADSRVDVQRVLKEGSGGGRGRRQRLRAGLIVVEAASTMVLLVGVGLLAKGFVVLRQRDPGFDPSRLIVFRMDLPEPQSSRSPSDSVSGDDREADVRPRVRALVRRVVERLEALPEVESATAASALPPWAGPEGTFAISDRRVPDDPSPPTASYNVVDRNFFDTMKARLRKGRGFSEEDSESSPPVVVINEAMARRYWPNEDPVGRQIEIAPGADARTCAIAGVVADMTNQGMSPQAAPEMYVPYFQESSPTRADPASSRVEVSFVVRTHSSSGTLADEIRRAVATVDGGLGVYDLTTMGERMDAAAQEILVGVFLNGFIVGLAIALTTVGIYGVVSFSVSRRVREMGIRIAMGAGRFRLLELVVGQGLKLMGAGIALGLVGALALNRVLSSLLQDVVSVDLLLILGATTILVAAALAASAVPAWRAASVDPVFALRHE